MRFLHAYCQTNNIKTLKRQESHIIRHGQINANNTIVINTNKMQGSKKLGFLKKQPSSFSVLLRFGFYWIIVGFWMSHYFTGFGFIVDFLTDDVR